MERAIFPPAITIPLHQIRFPLLIGEVDRHRQSGKPLAPKIYPITLPVEWASYINTFPTGSHRYPSEIACVLMAFCLHHNASFRHGFDTVIVGKKVVFFVRVLSMFCHKKKPVFCTTFDTLLIRPIISKKPCAAMVFGIGSTQNHYTTDFMGFDHGFPSISAASQQQPQDSSHTYGIGYRPGNPHRHYAGRS